MRRTDDAWRAFSTLHGFVRLVLLVDWDPIGILGYSGAMDEYDSYAKDVCDLIQSGATRETLVAHLEKIEKQWMGMRGERSVQTEVADKLLLLYKTIQRDDQMRQDTGEGETD